MAIPAHTMRLALSGHLYGSEIFQTNLWFTTIVPGDPVPVNNTEAAAALDELTTGTQWTALLTALTGMLRAACGYDRADLYCYDAGGTAATAQASKSLTGPGTSTLGTLPNQVARVVTLNTNQAGRSRRGRLYLPATGLAMDATTGLFSANPSSVLDALSDYIGQQRISNSWSAIVVSQKTTSYAYITSLKTDQRPDIQRRRANRENVGTTYIEPINVD